MKTKIDVIIGDPDSLNRRLITRILNLLNQSVLSNYDLNIQEAASKKDFDLIMPKTNGRTLIFLNIDLEETDVHLKNKPKFPLLENLRKEKCKAEILALSAFGYAYEDDTKKAGANNYITLPWERENFEETVMKMIKKLSISN